MSQIWPFRLFVIEYDIQYMFEMFVSAIVVFGFQNPPPFPLFSIDFNFIFQFVSQLFCFFFLFKILIIVLFLVWICFCLEFVPFLMKNIKLKVNVQTHTHTHGILKFSRAPNFVKRQKPLAKYFRLTDSEN